MTATAFHTDALVFMFPLASCLPKRKCGRLPQHFLLRLDAAVAVISSNNV